MERVKLPPGLSKSTGSGLFSLCVGLTETFDILACSSMAQSMHCSSMPRRGLLERALRDYEGVSRVVFPLPQYGDSVL